MPFWSSILKFPVGTLQNGMSAKVISSVSGYYRYYPGLTSLFCYNFAQWLKLPWGKVSTTRLHHPCYRDHLHLQESSRWPCMKHLQVGSWLVKPHPQRGGLYPLLKNVHQEYSPPLNTGSRMVSYPAEIDKEQDQHRHIQGHIVASSFLLH